MRIYVNGPIFDQILSKDAIEKVNEMQEKYNPPLFEVIDEFRV